MDFKFNYNTEKERSNILKENEHLYLKKDAELLNEKYLILTDVQPDELPLTEIELMQEKISILEAENENLKEGLRAVLRGDMQSLAYILYPEDFNTFRK